MNSIHYLCYGLFFVGSISELVQGFETTVEFNNKSLPLSMSTESYFKNLANKEASNKEMTWREDTLLQVKRRSKRFITFNVLAPIDLGFLLAIPITLMLPSMSNLFNTRIGRSIPEFKEETYEDDPTVQTHLDRVSNYFDLLQISDKECHQRAICEFSSSPEKYYPLSEMILQRIRNPADVPASVIYQTDDDASTGQNHNNKGKHKSLFKLYNKAADHGMIHGDSACHEQFSKKCPHSIEKRLNMPVLKFWNALKTLLKFTIKDTV